MTCLMKLTPLNDFTLACTAIYTHPCAFLVSCKVSVTPQILRGASPLRGNHLNPKNRLISDSKRAYAWSEDSSSMTSTASPVVTQKEKSGVGSLNRDNPKKKKNAEGHNVGALAPCRPRLVGGFHNTEEVLAMIHSPQKGGQSDSEDLEKGATNRQPVVTKKARGTPQKKQDCIEKVQ